MEEVHQRASWPFLIRCFGNIDLKCNILYKLSAQATGQNFGKWKVGEAQETMRGSPGVLFLYKYRRVLDRKRDLFSRLSWESIVRRTISFYNKQSYVSIGESCMDFFKCMLWASWIWIISFQLVSINCEIILTHWISFHVMNVLWFILWNFHIEQWRF